MGEIVDVEINKKLFQNVDESALTTTFAALENMFVTEANGLSRFPGLKEFVDFGGSAEIHMGKYNNDMIACGVDGRVFVVDQNKNFHPVEGPPVLGGKRISFAPTRDGTFMAAGAQIIKFDGVKTSVLSQNAPLSSFVGYIDGYLLAVEKDSGRFYQSGFEKFSEWNPADSYGVDGSPDNISNMVITPFNEILFSGVESIEQYERNVGGGQNKFFRRWMIGDGISEPYTFVYADNAVWGLNSRHEFARMSGQTSQSVSDDIQKRIEETFSMAAIGSLKKSWAGFVSIKGQKFIIFQSPEGINSYGSKGFTAAFDIRRGHWFELFGWDYEVGVPALWQGRSVFSLWGKTFIGGNGKIYELRNDVYENDGKIQRCYARTAHFDAIGTARVNRVIITIKRGVGDYQVDPQLVFRSNPDNKGFGNHQYRYLGKTGSPYMTIEFGAQGIADTWQFEFMATDNCEIEIRKIQLDVTRMQR